ncbi:MAG: M1 family metallopeptidase [Phycisphaerales bacterium]|nr:MAG: M1 family metallopeptidase [Phycisphaerales bacterium]
MEQTLIAMYSAILAFVPLAANQRPILQDDKKPVGGCGKARTMLARYANDHDHFTDATAMEPLWSTDVLHYELDIEISNINTLLHTCTITGSNRMTIQSKHAYLREFSFRLWHGHTITGAFINDTQSVLDDIIVDSETTRRVLLDPGYFYNEIFTLTIEYTGTSVSHGLDSFEVRTQSGVPVVGTLSEPYYSYTWWPTKDGDVGLPGDNSDKATLEFSITTPDNLEIPANGVLESIDLLSGNRHRWNWVSDYPITPYLVAFCATDYHMWTKQYNHANGSMPVEFYIYPGYDTVSHRQSWGRVVSMLEVFAPLFGEYPFIEEKYGIYNFPFGGGMEHQTITGQGSFDERLTAHELAHQWWGDMITCRTWSDIWLNEGFATYGECLWKEHEFGTINRNAYRSCMLSEKPYSVSGSVYIPANEISVYRIFSSDYSYKKGAWVLHQLRYVVGDETFFQILADYREQYAFSAASTDDFVTLASATHGEDLAWFFDQWVYQKGAPAYQYGWDMVKLNGQEYFHVRVEQTQSTSYPHVFITPLDIFILDDSAEVHTVWNDQRTQTFVIPVDGAVTNVAFDPYRWILFTTRTEVQCVAGDTNGDLLVDLAEYAAFHGCLTGPADETSNDCQPIDFDGDSDVDLLDFAGLQVVFQESQ